MSSISEPMTDDAEFAKRLQTLLEQTRLRSRMHARGLFAASLGQRRPPLVWGGATSRYHWCWGAVLLGSVALPGLAAWWFNAHGRGLPGGAFNLLWLVAALVGGPGIAALARARRLRRAPSAEAGVAEEGTGAHLFPRRLLRPCDWRWPRLIACRPHLSVPMTPAVALNGCRSCSNRSPSRSLPASASSAAYAGNGERMRSAAETFMTHRPADVAELTRVLHEEG